jgi:hypothetical protein
MESGRIRGNLVSRVDIRAYEVPRYLYVLPLFSNYIYGVSYHLPLYFKVLYCTFLAEEQLAQWQVGRRHI